MKKHLLIALVVLFFSAIFSSLPFAKVTGPCANCHTMHNMQNGAEVVSGGPLIWLLKSNCVSCHMANNGTTWKDPVTGAPIVYNTSPPTYGASYNGGPKQGLAGGNFYWVATAGGADDTKGHNVWGISGQDSKLSDAPGRLGGCTNSCHFSLALDPATTKAIYTGARPRNGCEGCHVNVTHHLDGAYRFLDEKWDPGSKTFMVRGVGDPNWEYSPSSSNHNIYLGKEGTYTLMDAGGNISAYCAGCHYNYHAPKSTGMGTGSPWLRHPNDVVIPASGEYSGYTTYNPLVPVGRLEGNFPTDPSEVRPGIDMVICLSCHRAHGSPYRDMLRWDYDAMVAGGGGSGGCFTCHTQKK